MLRWLPWRWLLRRTANRYRILDPATILARVRQFSEPSEVHEPLEIVRAWLRFHARGVVNTRAIQHNLDWLWPYWIERQFDPADESFIPRAYAPSHVNLTHRNWTAVGLPNVPLFPIVDPRGLLTPLYDGWSLDAWLRGPDGARLLPARCPDAALSQTYLDDPAPTVLTICRQAGLRLRQRVWMDWAGDEPRVHLRVHADGPPGSTLCAALRPYNPEGVQFVDRLALLPGNDGWQVNDSRRVLFDRAAERCLVSAYDQGDVLHSLATGRHADDVTCRVGMATAAATFPLRGASDELQLTVPLGDELAACELPHRGTVPGPWPEHVARHPACRLPEPGFSELFTHAARTVALLTPYEVYPGPYVYRRFWYRDAAFMLNALLSLNHVGQCRRLVAEVFPERQKSDGYFESQEGEWDANGAVLWSAERLARCAGIAYDNDTVDMLRRGADWIGRKRHTTKGPHAGLLPPGFSAEHLGPNNYFLWDDFWAIGGLRAMARFCHRTEDTDRAERYRAEADEFDRRLWEVLRAQSLSRTNGAVPAAPNRRLDSGAVGSLVADYPLQLYAPAQDNLMATASFLHAHCRCHGAFFQDMTHSGMNAYLTLHLAQVLLRASDRRFLDLVRSVAAMASPTGQWPEAVHPRTGGGCMGDGQHGWAAAEWVQMMRALFLREEHDRLVLGPGLVPEWLESSEELLFGPTPTPWGPVTVQVHGGDQRHLELAGDWHGEPPPIQIALPGRPVFDTTADAGSWAVAEEGIR